MPDEISPSSSETAGEGLSDAAQNTSLSQDDPKADATSASNSTTKDPAGNGAGSSVGKPDSGSQEKGSQTKPKDSGQNQQVDQPIKDWSQIKLDLPKDADVDDALLGDFGKKAVELGLTEKQAKALVSFQLDAVAAQREALMEAGVKDLSARWGAKAQENQQAVMGLLATLDRQLGDNKFTKALNRCGATLLPDVCDGLLYIAKAVSEDSMGRGGSAAPQAKRETAEDALQAEWDRVRGKR